MGEKKQDDEPPKEVAKEIRDDDSSSVPVEQTSEAVSENAAAVSVTGPTVEMGMKSSPGDVAHVVTTPAERQRAFQVLWICLVCLGMGQSSLFSVLPPMARDLGLTEVQIGFIFTISAAVFTFMSQFWGRQSDVWGRKTIILLGLCAYAVSMFLFAVSFMIGLNGSLPLLVVYFMLMVSRLLYPLFGAGAQPSAHAYVADRTSPSERASGVAMVQNAFSVGTVLGPGVAGALIAISLLAPFFFTVVIAFASAIGLWLWLPERTSPSAFEREQMREAQKSQDRIRLFDERIFPLLIIGFIVGITQSINFQIIGYYIMDKLGQGTSESIQLTSVAFLATAMAAVFAQFGLIGRFNLSTRFMVRSGVLIAMFANFFIAVSVSYGMIVFGFFAMGLGLGLVRPGIGATASLAVSKTEQGSVAGLVASTGAAGFIIGPIIGPAVYRYTIPEAPFIFNTVMLVGCVAYIYLGNLARRRDLEVPDEADSGIPKG